MGLDNAFILHVLRGIKRYKSCWDWVPCKESEIFKTSTSSSYPTRPYCIIQKQPKSRDRKMIATGL